MIDKLAIMQPYFFPYIGYFQLIDSVDEFIIYDNIQYTKKGWIIRNRLLQNSKDVVFSLSLKKDSDYLNIRDRILSNSFDREKLLRRISSAYKNAPFFSSTYSVIEEIVYFDDYNLFNYLHNSIIILCQYLGVNTNIILSSNVGIDTSLKNQEKVLALCKEMHATSYINAIGGLDLYSKEEFKSQGVNILFIKQKSLIYSQFSNKFVPNLSIIDVMMFNSVKKIKLFMRNGYELL